VLGPTSPDTHGSQDIGRFEVRRVRLQILIPLALISLGLPTVAAHAAWPSDPQVNVPLSAAAGSQLGTVIIADGVGGAIVAWYDRRSGVNDHIYAQRVDASGSPQWTPDGVPLCLAANDQQYPTIVSDGEGGAIVTWQDFRSGTNWDVYAQRVNAAGEVEWPTDGVALCSAAGTQGSPMVASDGAHGAIVAWYDSRSGSFDIYAQRVNAAGAVQWPTNGVAICTAAFDQFNPVVTSDEAGGAIVAWYDQRLGSSAPFRVYAQRVDAAGAPLWTSNGVALCTAANNEVAIAVVPDGAHGAIAAWQDYRSGTNYDLFAQRVNATGTLLWNAAGVALCTAANFQYAPAVTPDGLGGAIVAWYDGRSGTHADVYAQRVDTTGTTHWTAGGVALCNSGRGQYYPTVAADGAGGAIVAWQDERTGPEDIFAQHVDAAGAPEWDSGGVALSLAVDDQSRPVVVSNGAGGAIVAWQDYRSSGGTNWDGYSDIYAQNVGADGSLGGSLLSVLPPSSPRGFSLSVQPNPSAGDLRARFSLPDGAPSVLELYDVSGRRLVSMAVERFGHGVHEASLTPHGFVLPPGVYCVVLRQGSRSALRKVAVVR